jgi:uncharacterized RDD family membrane protein YckC
VIVGKVALLEWVGLRLGQATGVRAWQKPLGGFVLGAVILTLFYMVWVVGLLAYIWFSIWGLGVAVTAALESLRRRRMQARAAAPAPMAPAPAMASAGPAEMSPSAAPADMNWSPQGSAAPPASEPAPPTLSQPAARPVAVPEALAWPRAGFWERMAAAFLDMVLLGVILSTGYLTPRWFLVVALAYFAGIWTWKATSIGGIVLGLKVVRLDGQPLDFPVALVRALAAGLSVIVFFLGFLWIAWDAEKQGWHDRIAGTVVLRLPRGTPLV